MTPGGRHTPPGDRSFVVSLLRQVAAGAALVAVVAAAFWGIGQLRPPSGDPVIEQPTEDVAAPPTATGDPASGGESTPPTDAATPTDTAPDDPSPTATTAEPTADATTDSPSDVDPSEVSVQVLDAAGDGGARADDAAERLRDLGYRVVAVQRAVRVYEDSTVFYTEGRSAEARAVADDLPGSWEIDEKPSNLSDTVDVHVVVGEDYPAPD